MPRRPSSPLKSSRQSRIGWQIAAVFLALSVSLLVCVCLAYGTRADAWAALSQLPAWLWPLPGGLLTAGAWRVGWRAVLFVSLLWVGFTLAFVDELIALPHALLPAPDSERTVRVVSLNCGGGLPEAAAEVAAHRPDVVLLQESPRRADVDALAQRLYGANGGASVGWDGSVLARGRVHPLLPRKEMRATWAAARIILDEGKPTLYVVSLRLNPPSTRLDLWNPACWQQLADEQRRRRAQLRKIMTFLDTLPPDAPVLVGGDFNAPAGDGALTPLRARGLSDAFRHAGRGWGNTITNEMPFHRIDQIWTDPARLRPVGIRAFPTVHSDHRLVRADFARPTP